MSSGPHAHIFTQCFGDSVCLKNVHSNAGHAKGIVGEIMIGEKETL